MTREAGDSNEASLERQRHLEKCASLRYSFNNILLYDISLLIFFLLAVAALAGAIFALVNHKIQKSFLHVSKYRGFASDFHLFGDPKANGTRSTFNIESAFLFNFLPTLLVIVFNILWLNTNVYYQYTEPFARMQQATTGPESLLLNYPATPPVVITLKAAMNGHFRVAIFSLFDLLGPATTIVATNIFVSTPAQIGYNIKTQAFNFWFCFSAVSLYLVAIPFARPTPAYRLPRAILNIADLLSFCYASHIFDDKIEGHSIFSVQDPTDSQIHLQSKIHLSKQEYQFGVYEGKDRQKHLGFDVAGRGDRESSNCFVDFVYPGRQLYLSPGWRPSFRKPRVESKSV